MIVIKEQIDELLRAKEIKIAELEKVKNTIANLQKLCQHTYVNGSSALNVADHYGNVLQCDICRALISNNDK